MKKLTKAEVIEMLGPEWAEAMLTEHILRYREIAEGILVFQNQQMDSSEHGQTTAVIYGPGCTFKSPEVVDGKWLGDLPSQRKHFVGYITSEEFLTSTSQPPTRETS